MPKRYDHLFDTGHLKEQLKEKAVRSSFNLMAAQVISFVLRMGSMMILARILMPEHFGLISMVTSLTIIVERFQDMGLSTATMQRKEITHEQVSALFWINVGFGTLLMTIIAALSWVIAWFFSEHRLVGITIALSSTFFLGGLTVQHLALLRRQMRFGEIAWIQIVSESLSIAISIGLAWQGFKYWALVWKEIARGAFIVLGTWVMCQWRPTLPSRAAGLNPMLRVGRDISGSNIVHLISQNFDQILLGRFWGAGPLGFYRQASMMLHTPLSSLYNPIGSVSIPALSALQNEPWKYSRYCEKVVSILSFVSLPLLTYCIIFSNSLVRLMLGEKWIDSVPIFRILAIAALVMPIASICSSVMITCGKTARNFWYSVLGAVILIPALSIGISWGPIGVAAAYTISGYIWIYPSLWYSFRGTPVSIHGILKAMFRPAFCSFIMGVILVLVFPGLFKRTILEIPLSLVIGILSFCGAWLLFPGGKNELKQYLSYPLLALRLRAGSQRVMTL